MSTYGKVIVVALAGIVVGWFLMTVLAHAQTCTEDCYNTAAGTHCTWRCR